MQKRVKITLYIILLLAIIAVVWLMFGSLKPFSKTTVDSQTPVEENIDENTNNSESKTNTFEEDVMKDLEGFFNDNNGYENIEGEYGFTNTEL